MEKTNALYLATLRQREAAKALERTTPKLVDSETRKVMRKRWNAFLAERN